MDDIVPTLLEQIEKDFAERVGKSDTLKRIEGLIGEGKASYKEANEYAIEVGQILADVFRANLSSSALPDGKMYYNIADRILNQTMGATHDILAEVARQVQTDLNKASKIGIKAVKPPMDQSRVDHLVEKISEAENYDDVAWALDEPVVNMSQSIIDLAIKINAAFQSDSGLSPKIIRRSTGKCCEWCNKLIGDYDYEEIRYDDHDVFRRHRFCRCDVDYDPRDGSAKRNVHTKKWIDPEKDAKIEDRKKFGASEFHNSTPAKFARAVAEAKANVPEEIRWRVSAYEPDYYVGSKLHITERGSTVAVDRAGDIISVCRRDDDSVRGSQLLKEAVNKGGVKLDSFAGNHGFYIKNGFEPVSWCEWVAEHAPDDWKDGYAKEPIIFYKYTGVTVEVSLSDFFSHTQASIDYNAAKETRDREIKP